MFTSLPISKLPQPAPHLLGSGKLELVEDVDSLDPSLAGSVGIAGRQQDLADGDKRISLMMPIAKLSIDTQSTLITVDGLAQMAETVVGIAHAVQGIGLAVIGVSLLM